jgi:hypothetical protein
MTFVERVQKELLEANSRHKPINSAHEGYAVILEELDEFWEEVRKKMDLRDKKKLLAELVQIAAMAQRTAEDLGMINCAPRALKRINRN